MVGAPHFINPLLAASDTDRDLSHLIFSGLTRIDEHGNIVPDLASGWQASPDSKVYTFTLRPNLFWHDGKPLTAEDVRFTLNILHDSDFPGDPGLASTWRDVQVETPTSQTVLLTLPVFSSSFIQYTTLGLLPAHLWSEVNVKEMAASLLNREPVGSGPWRYAGASDLTSDIPAPDAGQEAGVTTQPASSAGILLEPNPHSILPAPRISRLWFRFYPTFGAALTGFKTGEVHGLGHIPSDRISEVRGLPNIDLHSQSLARYAMLLLNLRSPLFDKVETRQAVALALDRESIVQYSLGGQASVADSPILPQSWAYDHQILVSNYDPDSSGRLLDEAGWLVGPDGLRARDGVTMTVVLAANKDEPSNVAVARQISDQLKKMGLDIKLALVSRDSLLNDYLGPRAFHMALVNWQAQGADPDVLEYWHSPQPQSPNLNFSGWSNQSADDMLEAAKLTPYREQRTLYYKQFQQIFVQDLPAIILHNPLYAYATRHPASGVTLPAEDMLDPAYRFDTVAGWYLNAKDTP